MPELDTRYRLMGRLIKAYIGKFFNGTIEPVGKVRAYGKVRTYGKYPAYRKVCA
jgi:hypothetical protein